MPVSHLGLTVSHIPTAASFYLTALQPLGYRFIGNQGNTVGLGVHEADLFLCPVTEGTRITPTHIAFTASSRLEVRDCYAAALGAGGFPSGAPSYRRNDCSCFNAAVEDQDGNTIEFIFRENGLREHLKSHAPSHVTRESKTERDVATDDSDQDAALLEQPPRSVTRARTALDLASTVSKATKNATQSPSSGTTPLSTLGLDTSFGPGPSRALMGTILGAAAGAAFAYAMFQSERDSARNEVAFAASTNPRGRTATNLSRVSRRSMSERPISREHRNWSVTESRVSARPPPTVASRATRAIAYEPCEMNDEVQHAISQYAASRRPQPKRRTTCDAHRSEPVVERTAYLPKRSTTLVELPVRQQFLLGGPNDSASRHTARDTGLTEKAAPSRRDSAMSINSHRSSRRSRVEEDDRRSSVSKSSTIKPVRWKETEQPVDTTSSTSRRSKADSRTHRSRPSSYYDAPESLAEPPRVDNSGDVSDGVDDSRTIVPDDSISCIDLSSPRPARSDHSRRSEKSHRSEKSQRSRNAEFRDAEDGTADRRSSTRHGISEAAKSSRSEKSQHSRDAEYRDTVDDVAERRSITRRGMSEMAKSSRGEKSQHSRNAEHRDAVDDTAERRSSTRHGTSETAKSSRSEKSQRSHKTEYHDAGDDAAAERRSITRHGTSETAKSSSTIKPTQSRHSAVTVPVRAPDDESRRRYQELRGPASCA